METYATTMDPVPAPTGTAAARLRLLPGLLGLLLLL